MPLTDKGRQILEKMEQEYGAEKGREVFYASANKGTITGVHDEDPELDPAKLDAVVGMCNKYDASVATQMKAKEIVDLMNKRGYGPREILEKIRAGYEVPQSMDPKAVATEAERVIRNKQNIKSMEVPSRRDATQLDDVMAACDEYEAKLDENNPLKDSQLLKWKEIAYSSSPVTTREEFKKKRDALNMLYNRADFLRGGANASQMEKLGEIKRKARADIESLDQKHADLKK